MSQGFTSSKLSRSDTHPPVRGYFIKCFLFSSTNWGTVTQPCESMESGAILIQTTVTVGKYLTSYLTIVHIYMLIIFAHHSPNHTPIHSFFNFMCFNPSPSIPVHILQLPSLVNHAEIVWLDFYCIRCVKVATDEGVHECIFCAL